MFTGIVEERGQVREVTTSRLDVSCRTVTSDAAVGNSIAVNGVCLTVVERSSEHLAFDLSEETVRRTSFSRLGPGDAVNLERPLTLSSRLAETENIDLPNTIMRLQMQQTGYEAALSATAKALSPTLLDYLR